MLTVTGVLQEVSTWPRDSTGNDGASRRPRRPPRRSPYGCRTTSSRTSGGVARAVARETQRVYYPNESPPLKAVVREALSTLVERRVQQNRQFLDGLDLQGRDRERDLGLGIDRLTELDPPYARRLRVVRPGPCEEMLVRRGWPPRPVGRLEDVPQTSGKVPAGPSVLFRVLRLPAKSKAVMSIPRHGTRGGPPVAAERGGSGAAARRHVPAIRTRATGLRSGTPQPAIDRDDYGVIAVPSVAGPLAGVPCPRARNAWRF